MVEGLLRDSVYKFTDNIHTSQTETLSDVVMIALKKATVVLLKAEAEGKLVWGKFKDSGIRHLLRLPALSRFHLNVGGGKNIINATKDFHGPSWRMIVHLAEKTEAYGVYPGGQSGNPGSKYYDMFVNTWADGKYYSLWFMKENEKEDKRVIGKMSLEK
jgi:penicillin amidase